MRKITKEQSDNLDLLYKRFIIYYNFMLNKHYEPQYHHHSIEGLKEYKLIADGIYEKQQLTKMRQLNKEIDAEMREELGSKSIEVKRLFHEQLGEDIEAEEQKYQKKLEAIIKRGKIKTEAEYRFIETRHQELFPEQGNTDEVLELDRLLGTFQL